MAVYIVTGKLGGGKTLVSVGRIRDKLKSGCVVATNLDLQLPALLGPMVRDCRVLRVPDKPTRADLDAIGCGNPDYDEARNGLLVLDELGTWLNSRAWQDKSRAAVIDWFLHARKLGWDLILIVQDIDILDAQARAALAELVVYCRRTDRISIPLIGTLFKLVWGDRLPLPRVHVAAVRYGAEHNALSFDRWVYRGNDLFAAYDTRQAFLADYPHGVYSVLPPWHTRGRFMVPRNREFYMRMTKIMWRRFSRPVVLAAGIAAGAVLTAGYAAADWLRAADAHREAVAHLEQRQPEPVAQLAPAAVDDAGEPDSLDILKGRRIVAWIGNGAKTVYVLGVPGSSDLLTSRDLAESGYSVYAMSRCQLRVRKGQTVQVITCIDPISTQT